MIKGFQDAKEQVVLIKSDYEQRIEDILQTFQKPLDSDVAS